ncbi:MAG: YdeI/OmpD-associated family protein [Rikenellaceae bacterium]|nr:YdeI/OmpD-associated family protein [Rikenellaceae bacterium]
MEEEIFYAPNRRAWREWLEKNFQKKKLVWLQFPNKTSGRPSVAYSDAVEEAIYFGWIDSTIRAYDQHSSIQRFSVRNPKSTFSQLNKERLAFVYRQGLIRPSVLESLQSVLDEKFHYPEDILARIKEDPEAWRHYQAFSEPYKRIRLAYIDIARPYPEHFEKRLRHFLRKTREGKLIVARGSEKYY